MTYKESQAFFESYANQGIKPGLSRIQRLMDACANPHLSFPVVLVGGTNGKGSTVRILSRILEEAGYHVGSYYSPHLHSLRERFCINGEPISEEKFADHSRFIQAIASRTYDTPSQFELLTAFAFSYFHSKGIQIGIFEVGLGGRWDATNCAPALVSIITNVDLDHTSYLGTSLEEIAEEKAGIARRNRILILGAIKPLPGKVIELACARSGASLLRAWDFKCIHQDEKAESFTYRGSFYHTPLLGTHQVANASCALEAAYALEGLGFPISEDHRKSALGQIHNPGRMEVLPGHPTIVLDGAHNPAGMEALAITLDRFRARRRIVILGILEDKDIGNMVRTIVSGETFLVATRSRSPRAAPTQLITSEAPTARDCIAEIPEVSRSLAFAKEIARPDDLVCVTGSLTTVAEAREVLLR